MITNPSLTRLTNCNYWTYNRIHINKKKDSLLIYIYNNEQLWFNFYAYKHKTRFPSPKNGRKRNSERGYTRVSPSPQENAAGDDGCLNRRKRFRI
jgi:hypothetical protein